MNIVRHRFKAYGAIAQLFECQDPEVLLDGPANTGKSRGIGERLLYIAKKWPGARIAVVRKTRASLTEAFLVTWETKCLGEGVDAWALVQPIAQGPQRSHRHSYEFKNGSVVVTAGMDNPTRLYSTEWDIIYVQEAIELSEDEWERLTRGLRNKVVPFQQIIGDTNPDAPQHWLNQRCLRGQTTRIQCRHSDNPTISEQDLKRLSMLTGVRRARLFEGKWVAAEGQVWENWDPAVHMLDKLPPGVAETCHYVAGVDWGFTNAGTIGVWAVDRDRRMYLVRQVYQRGRTVDWWVAMASALRLEFKVKAFVCDPSQPAHIRQMRNAGIPAKEADNDIIPGLDAVRERLATAGDGKPRLYVVRGSLQSRDKELDEAKQPCCLEDEIPAYVYPEGVDGRPIKEEPDPACADHGCDACRYVTRYVDRYDLHDRTPPPKYAAGTFGEVLGHGDDD